VYNKYIYSPIVWTGLRPEVVVTYIVTTTNRLKSSLFTASCSLCWRWMFFVERITTC